jgi:sulfur carrier protein
MECQPTLQSSSFEVVINGEKRTVPRDQTVIGLVRDLGLEPERVAVELDRHIIRRAEWPETQLREGARLEIVQFVGGG